MRALISLFILLAAWAAPALAQSPPPLGYWVSRDGSGEFFISASGCRYHTMRGMNLVGTCSWDANYAGGILTLTYPSVTGPQHIYYSISYVNQDTILIFGETYYHRG